MNRFERQKIQEREEHIEKQREETMDEEKLLSLMVTLEKEVGNKWGKYFPDIDPIDGEDSNWRAPCAWGE